MHVIDARKKPGAISGLVLCATLEFRTNSSERNDFPQIPKTYTIKTMTVENTNILTARSTLKAFSPSDASELYSCISPELTKFMSWEPPSSETAFAEVWKGWLRSTKLGTEVFFVARDKENGRCLGLVGVHSLHTSTPELGIWLRSDVHSMGFGKELIGAVLGWVSKYRPVRFFEYPVAEENIASRRVAEGYGGKVNGRRRNPKYNSVVYHIPPLDIP